MPHLPRRAGLALPFLLLAPHGAGLAQPPLGDILPQRPDSPLAGRRDFYGRMANPGRHGWSARRPVRYSVPGQPRPLVVWSPPGATRVRPLVFSHGELGGPELYSPLLNHWASHGFLVLAPAHEDSLTLSSFRRSAEIREAGTDGLLSNPGAWRDRVQDLRVALDALPTLARETGFRIDDERPMLAGHSLGSFSAGLLMGMTASTGGEVSIPPDPRFFGALLLSPQGRGVLGLGDASWSSLRSPAMWMSGPGDIDPSSQRADAKVEGFALSPPGNRHLGWLARVSPPWYGGQVRPGDLGETVYADIRAFTTAFLRSYAEYDGEALSEFSSERFNSAAGGRALHSWR